MNRLINKYKKPLLAVFTVGLMIVFVATSGYGRGSSSRKEILIGTMGKTKLYSSESETAKREWQLLMQNVSGPMQSRYGEQPQMVPLPMARMGPALTSKFADNPDLFMLLRHEARAAGVRVNNDELEDILHNNVRPNQTDDDTYDAQVREAVTDLLLIESNFSRATAAIKISKPERDQAVARLVQQISLDVAEFPATRFESSAAVTPQLEQAQFDRLANVAPGIASADNPFAFGYRLPDQVRLQYLTISQDDVRKAVEASMSPYDWDVKTNLYYLQNPQNFPTTQAAEAATRPALGPTTKPFKDVHDEALQEVRRPMIEKLALDVQSRALTAMQSAWARASATTHPAAADLQKIADAVTAEFHVPVHVTDLSSDALSVLQLSALPGIGSSNNGRQMFGIDVMTTARNYLNNTAAPDALHNLQKPGTAEVDDAKNIYLYRLVDATAAHPAPSLASVKDQLDRDLRTAAGYDRAKSAALAMVTAVASTGFRPAAAAASVDVSTTAPFSGSPNQRLTGVKLSDAARAGFIRRAFNLLSRYDPAKDPHPSSLIEVPEDSRVFVVRLAEVTRQMDAPVYLVDLEMGSRLRQPIIQKFLEAWFNYGTVADRLDYKPANAPKQAANLST